MSEQTDLYNREVINVLLSEIAIVHIYHNNVPEQQAQTFHPEYL